MKRILLMLTMMLSMAIAGTVYAGGTMNVNTASVEQLQAVKGIGPKTAEEIVAYRKANGDFSTIEGLTAVKGIGEKKLAKIKGSLTVEKAKSAKH